MSAAAHAKAASRDPVSESDSSSSLGCSDSSSFANNARVTRNSSSSSSTSSSSTSSDDTPSVAKRPVVKKGGGEEKKTNQKRNLTSAAKRSSSSDSDVKSVVPSGKLFIALILSILYEKHLLCLTSAMAMRVQKSWSTSRRRAEFIHRLFPCEELLI